MPWVDEIEDLMGEARYSANHAGYITLPYETLKTLWDYIDGTMDPDDGDKDNLTPDTLNAIRELRRELSCAFMLYVNLMNCRYRKDSE